MATPAKEITPKTIVYRVFKNEDNNWQAEVFKPGKDTPFLRQAESTARQCMDGVEILYGMENLVRLNPSEWEQYVLERTVHSEQTLILLQYEIPGCDLRDHYVYGSKRSLMGENIQGATFINTNFVTTGFWTYVVKRVPLDEKIIADHKLWFVSRPHPTVCAWCTKVTPKDQLTGITTTVDADSGMSKAEELVCDDCMEPHREAQAETDATSDPTMPDPEFMHLANGG